MQTPAIDATICLNVDIFFSLLDTIISHVKRVNNGLEPAREDLLVLGRTLRLVCRGADAKLRQFMSPVLELASVQQAAMLLFGQFPGQASIRSVTVTAGVPTVFLSPIVMFLLHWPLIGGRKDTSPTASIPNTRLRKLVLDYRDTRDISLLDVQQITFFLMFSGVSDLSIICPERSHDAGDDIAYMNTPLIKDKGPLKRLALHGTYIWKAMRWDDADSGSINLRILAIRLTPNSSTLRFLEQEIISIVRTLERLVLISSPEDEIAEGAVPLALTQKRDFALQHPAVTIIEVRPPIEKEGIPAWFAEHVRNDIIWDLEGVNWLDHNILL